MRRVRTAMTNAWKSQTKTGQNRPVVRATISKQNMQTFDYDTAWAMGGAWGGVDKHRKGQFTSFLFGDPSAEREILNILSVSWDRSVSQDVATCTLTMLNTEMVPIGGNRDELDPDVVDKPGYFTYNRGAHTVEPNPWGFGDSGWEGWFVPDRLVRTYEGYGINSAVRPDQDENLLPSGTWMIDKVTYGADGTMSLEMRDVGRLLLDQIVFPPVIPRAEYPMTWGKLRTEQVPARDCRGGHWIHTGLTALGTASSSNTKYVGKGLVNPPQATYVSASGAVDGHRAIYAITNDNPDPVGVTNSTTEVGDTVLHFAGSPTAMGLTVGKKVTVGDIEDVFFEYSQIKAVGAHTITLATSLTFPHGTGTKVYKGVQEGMRKWWSTHQRTRDSMVWWEYEFDENTPVGAIRLTTSGGPYKVFVSIHNGNRWVGKRHIPYKVTTGGVDIDADIPFVKAQRAERSHPFDIVLPRAYHAKKIRITITHLQDSGRGNNYRWSAGIGNFKVYTADDRSDLRYERGTVAKVVGNYFDYTQIVKWVCAWGGFYWPDKATGKDFIRAGWDEEGNPEKTHISYAVNDITFPRGRVWGDFMRSHTAGIADLTVDMFDKKPLMDVISYVRDLLGFNFYIDESGGVVFRMPNWQSLGNYVSPGMWERRGRQNGRTSQIVTLSDEDVLLSYSTTLDSSALRERIFVANVVGGVGTVIRGFNPYPAGLRRMVGWSDQNFKTKQETRVMADMISARNMFTYRRGQAVIPGYPGIQVDDQVRILERTTNETFYHYVMGIKSELSMESGEWTYSLDTHWLGERPSDAWVVKVDELDGATQMYLAELGYDSSGAEDDGGVG